MRQRINAALARLTRTRPRSRVRVGSTDVLLMSNRKDLWLEPRTYRQTASRANGHMFLRVFIASAGLMLSFREAAGQGALVGRVFSTEPTQPPIAGAEALLPRLGIKHTSDSLGAFRLAPLPAGEHILVIRAAGFEADTLFITVGVDESISKHFSLRRSPTRLAGMRVTATETPIRVAKHLEFYERMRVGIGQFLDRAAMQKWDGRPTGDMLATVPGIDARRSNNSKVWVVGGRYVSPGKCAFCKHPRPDSILDLADIASGAGIACYADVYLDGVLVYSSTSR